MRRWLFYSTLSHGMSGLCLGTLFTAIFWGIATPSEAIALYAVAMSICVGTGQALALRGPSPGALRWGLVTVAAILAGLALPEWLGPDTQGQPSLSPRSLMEVALSAAFLGAVVGTVQWAFALSRPDPFQWIGLTTLGWVLTISCILAGSNLVARFCLLPADLATAWPLWLGLVLATGCGALGGAAYGALTAPALPRPAA
jgi:hypothetical protein